MAHVLARRPVLAALLQVHRVAQLGREEVDGVEDAQVLAGFPPAHQERGPGRLLPAQAKDLLQELDPQRRIRAAPAWSREVNLRGAQVPHDGRGEPPAVEPGQALGLRARGDHVQVLAGEGPQRRQGGLSGGEVAGPKVDGLAADHEQELAGAVALGEQHPVVVQLRGTAVRGTGPSSWSKRW